MSYSCPGPGDPAEGPPECSCSQHEEPYHPQVPEVPDHAGGLQPAPGDLPWPYLPPHSRARLLRPPGGGEGPDLWGPDVSSSSLAWEKQLNSIMGPEDCLMGCTCGLRSMFPSLCVCVRACMQAHVLIPCVSYLHMLCVVGPVCASYVAGMCTMCYGEGVCSRACWRVYDARCPGGVGCRFPRSSWHLSCVCGLWRCCIHG